MMRTAAGTNTSELPTGCASAARPLDADDGGVKDELATREHEHDVARCGFAPPRGWVAVYGENVHNGQSVRTTKLAPPPQSPSTSHSWEVEGAVSGSGGCYGAGEVLGAAPKVGVWRGAKNGAVWCS